MSRCSSHGSGDDDHIDAHDPRGLQDTGAFPRGRSRGQDIIDEQHMRGWPESPANTENAAQVRQTPLSSKRCLPGRPAPLAKQRPRGPAHPRGKGSREDPPARASAQQPLDRMRGIPQTTGLAPPRSAGRETQRLTRCSTRKDRKAVPPLFLYASRSSRPAPS